MQRRIALWLAILAAVWLTGCATRNPMALSEGAPAPGKVVVLMSTTLANEYKPGNDPQLTVVHVERPGATESKDRFNFLPDDKARLYKKDDKGPRSYLLSMQLDPGRYELIALSSMVHRVLILGTFLTPLEQELVFEQPGVYYVGHVDARVRERKDDEMRAGPVIPLVDQAITGASGGTFDVTIADRWDEKDRQLFLSAYPQLEQINVVRQPLKPHDRERVRARFEAR